MISIYKYPFQIFDVVPIEMPAAAVPLCVQLQDGVPCIWMQVDTSNPTVYRALRIFGTGREVESYGLAYVGSIQMGPYVWHIYIRSTEVPIEEEK
jgi:hypothetical protein